MGNANATGAVPAVGETARQQLEEQPLPAQDAASSTPGHTQHGGDEQSHGHIQSLDNLPAPAIACTSLSPSSHMATTAVTSALAPAAIVTGGFDQTSSVSLPVAALHALAIGAAATVSSSESLAYSSTSAESGGELVATAAEAATAASMATPASMTIKRTTTALKDYDGPSRTAVESTSFKSTSSSSSGGGTAALRILGAGSLGTSSSSLGGATSPFSPRSASGPTAAQRLLGGASFRSAQPAPVVSIGSTVSSMDGNASAVRDAVSTTSYTQHGPATSIDATMLFSSATLNAPLCGSPLMTPSNFSSYSADPLRHASQVRESRRESVTSLPSGQSPSSHSGSLERGKTGGLTTSVDVDTRRGGEIGFGSMSTATASTTTSASGTLARGTADDDRTVPLILTWTLGGREVFVTGTFNDWRERIQLAKGKDDFTAVLHLKLGTHRLKFIVDGEWRCSNELETALDVHGNLVNYIEVKAEGGVMDILGQTAVSAMSLTASGRAATLRRASVQSGTEFDDYCQDVPFYLASKPAPSTTASSQDSVTRDAYLRSFQGGAASVPSSPGQPSSATRILSELSPLFPSQLDRIILNSHATPLAAVDYNQATLPVPNHVSLNHLFALSIKDGVMGVATTARFRKKYVSVVMYRPLVE